LPSFFHFIEPKGKNRNKLREKYIFYQFLLKRKDILLAFLAELVEILNISAISLANSRQSWWQGTGRGREIWMIF
jgi:hypothetical protein